MTLAEQRDDAAAVVVAGTGAALSYRQLDERSMRLARRLHAHGLRPGDHVAVLMESNPRYFDVFWAAMRSGLYLTPVPWHLDVAEVGHVIEACGASVVVTSTALGDLARSLGARRLSAVTLRLVVDGHLDGWTSYEEAVASQPARPLDEELDGSSMFYTSGTTGRPKGIQPPLSGEPFGSRPNPLAALLQAQWRFGPDSTYLCSLPLYHGASIGFSSSVQRLGGTVVLVDGFEPREFLDVIERHRVTHVQVAPIHLARLVALAREEGDRWDLSSLRMVVHAGAACPVELKRRALAWLGPIVHEYYTGTEANGFTIVGPEEWLEHPGTVGKPVGGAVHVLDEAGAALGPGRIGKVWFDTGARFRYHDAPEETAAAFDERGWSTLGDVGHLDEAGYLYLVDREAHVIRTGEGIVYPQQVEDVLLTHPAVVDAAVVGVEGPHHVQDVHALVQVADGVITGDLLAQALLDRCRARLPGSEPRSIEFVEDVGRLPTGKLPKRRLAARPLRCP
jgi:acyl-CoA synthetase (AMP-forming)/AMP-acid ligase II